MAATGYILAAAGVTLANEAIFAPLATGDNQHILQTINWKVVPATAVAAIALSGLDAMAKPLGTILAVLALVVAVVVPFGNATSPLDNLNRVFNGGATTGNVSGGGKF